MFDDEMKDGFVSDEEKTQATASSYSIRNAPLPADKPSFTVLRRQARSGGDMITFDYHADDPSDSTCVHPPINFLCYHDGTSVVRASGTVDDSVSIVAPGLNYSSPGGATHAFGATGSRVPAGYYQVSVVHSNIQSHPAGNVSVLTGSLGPCSAVTIVPDEDDEVGEDECSCPAGNEGQAGGTPPEAEASAAGVNAAAEGARAVASAGAARVSEAGSQASGVGLRLVPFASSSGGSGVVRHSNARHMRFAFSFGSFRGMGDVAAGQLEPVAFQDSEALGTPAALAFRHPFASVLVPEGERVAPGEMFRIDNGASRTHYICQSDGSSAFGVGCSAKKAAQLRFTSSLSLEASALCNLGDEGAAYVRLMQEDGSAVFYDLASNAWAGLITPDGATLLSNDKLAIVRAQDGAIRQVWNFWDGLADVTSAASGSGYVISLYLPCQVAAPTVEGELFTTQGAPFKTFTVSRNAAEHELTVREREMSLPESTPDYVTTWRYASGSWEQRVGEGEEALVTARVKSAVEDSGNYQVVTTLSRNGVAADCVREEYMSTPQGELCLSRTEGYGSEVEQTTSYSYDESGRLALTVKPDGGEYTRLYDAYGRVTVISSPWVGGKRRLVSTVYRDASSCDPEPLRVTESLVESSGAVRDMYTDTYAYSEEGQVKRVEVRRTASASPHTQLTVTESWLGSAENPHERGRVKMRQEADGVQTHYSYEADAAHGALYRVTAETRVEGELRPGQSRRRVEYISAEGNVLRTESFLLPEEGAWVLLSGESLSYDAQNRRIGSRKDNGRSTSRTLTCTGAVLQETDEEGITTTHSYDSARQLVESIRSEVRDGETLVTPETITTYTRDAAGRVLSLRRDIGAMSTTESAAYDALGRVISRTDALGRTTSTAYSEDGLATTVTTPAGATLITTRHPDGSIVHESGSGQRELFYVYDVNSGRLRETVKLSDGSTTLSQSLTNGFGQLVAETHPGAAGYIYTRREYNAKGQLIKQYQDTGSGSAATAPTLYEYDAFGNLTKQTLALADEPTPANSPIEEYTYSVENTEEGVYRVSVRTRYNAEGNPLTSTRKELLSQ